MNEDKQLKKTKSSEAKLVVFVALSAILVMGFYLSTVASNWIYSPDIIVLRRVLDIYPFTDLYLALLDNSAVIWAIYILRGASLSYMYLDTFYWLAFILKWLVLYRIYGWVTALTIIILFYFTFDMNQARLSLSMSFLLLSYLYIDRNRITSLTLSILGFMSHLPFAFVLVTFYSLCKVSIKYIAIALIAGMCLVYYLYTVIEASPAGRFIGYFDPMDGAEMTKFFLVALALLYIYRANLNRGHIIGSLILILISIISGLWGLINISGRTSELAALSILLVANLPITFSTKKDNAQLQKRSFAALYVAILFFVYRFTQWVILGNVPPPASS